MEDLNLSREQKEELLALLQEKDNRIKYNFVDTLWLDEDKAETIPGCLKSTARVNYPKHLEFFKAGNEFTERAFIAGNRPLSSDTLVRMADGTSKLLDDIKIGDMVLSLDPKTLISKPTPVIDIPYKGVERVYKIEAARGKWVEATEDHEFPVFTKSGHNHIKNMAIKNIPTDVCVSCKKGLITPRQIEFSNQSELPIHPYVLGALLGDGSLKFDSITITNKDEAVLNKFKNLSGWELKSRDELTYRIVQGNLINELGQFKKGFIRVILDKLGLFDKTHIPLEYKTSSIQNRLELLAGLIDTDGTNREFVNKHEQLVKDFCDVVNSVGGFAHYKACRKCCTNTGAWGTYYRAYFRLPYKLPLALEYKQPKLTKRICNYSRHPINTIQYVGVKPVTCITVEDKNHLFLVNDFIATSNCGKTLSGLYELYLHCSGEYPYWWEGKRFTKPIVAWLCGDRGEVVRDGIQPLLVGHTEFGTGIVPLDKFAQPPVAMPGIPQGYGQYFIKHKTGGVSKIIVKTYQSGKDAFESAAVDVIMLDEECPLDIYVESQMRTATTGGIVYLTFTPDSGLTDTVLHFMDKPKPGEARRFVAMIGWNDIPHLAEDVKTKLLAAIPPHLRDVKTKGIPYLGAGAIYPICEDEFVIPPFKIPTYWPKAYGFDPSWSRTAVVWGAYDEDADCWYLYDEYIRGQSETEMHAAAIQARGKWMSGVVDPHGSNNGKGVATETFLEKYESLGLNLMKAEPSGPGSVAIGIDEVFSRLSTGRMKVFNTLSNWLFEYRIYRRDDKGKIVKSNDDGMDATRYLMLNGHMVMSTATDEEEYNKEDPFEYTQGRSRITGY